MKMSEALEIVYGMADQFCVASSTYFPDNLHKAETDRKRREALNMVHDLIVNEYEED